METNRNDALLKFSLGIVSVIAIFFILIQLQSILIPFVFAALLTLLTYPIIEQLVKWKVPKILAILIVSVLIIGMLFLIYFLVATSSRGFSQGWGNYSVRLTAIVAQILAIFGYTPDEMLQLIDAETSGFSISSVLDAFFSSGIISGLLGSITSFLGDVFIVLLFWLFMSGGRDAFEKKLDKIFGGREGQVMLSYEQINKQVRSYILIKTLISFLTGTLTGLIVVLTGGDFAILWGIVAFLLNFIPNIGSLIATAFPILFLFLKFGVNLNFIAGSILLILNQNIIGNYLEPIYLGKHLNLSTVFVLLSLLFWGWVWGISGMFLAVPFAAICIIIFENNDSLKPLALLLGGGTENLKNESEK
ncbi:MAG: AI-2E family transporter [Ignavibacteriaceae bacterium]|nr:AI-2E family transporter [Ignavibacteriaceae bacterium]